jgi:ATP-dependent Clp protease adaptor protein ClpS
MRMTNRDRQMFLEATIRSVSGTRLSGSSTETAPQEKTRRKMTTEPPYKVILHNDDYTPMEHVVKVLRKVIPRMNLRRAVSIMLEAHTKGKAIVTKCHKELAELYQEGLKAEGLIATIEPD